MKTYNIVIILTVKSINGQEFFFTKLESMVGFFKNLIKVIKNTGFTSTFFSNVTIIVLF